MDERVLILIRHAKAETGNADLARRLADRGRRDAAAIGRWLAEQDLRPDQVVVSPAARTVETWQLAEAELGSATSVTRDERIYDNTPAQLLDVARDAAGGTRVLAIVGHNPSIHTLAARWSAASDESSDVVADCPTSTVVVFGFAGDWADVNDVAPVLRAVQICRG